MLSTPTSATNLLNSNPLNTTPTTNLLQASTPLATPITHTFTVTSSSDSGTGSLRQAILNANADTSGAADVINFNLGTGAHTITLTSATLDITAKNLTINGTGANLLTISGNNKLEDFAIEAGANVTISGLTITQGFSTFGGGIHNGGILTLNQDTLSNNVATMAGGAISSNSVLTINGSLFNQNTAPNGGAIASGGTLTINASTFINNSATAGGDGGAIYNSGTFTISGSTFANNTASTNAGGAIFSNGTGTIKANTLFSVNTAVNGGAIENAGTLTVDSGIFINNSSAGFGGAIVDVGTSNLTVTNSIFTGNTAPGGFGGAILNNNASTLTVSTSSFTNNSSALGAAIFNNNATDAIINFPNFAGLTFSGNTSTSATGTLANNNNIDYAFGPNITVDSLADTNNGDYSTGHISLREAIAAIAPGGTINFASTLTGGTITLALGELDINSNVTINGLGATNLAISGNHTFRDFNIGTGANVAIAGLTITQGNGTNGGGILNNGTLTLNGDIITNNSATLAGGGVYNTAGATVNVHNTSITKNIAPAGPDVFGSFISQGGNTIGSLDATATGFVNGQNGDMVQKLLTFESYTFTYNYVAQPLINGGPTAQDYRGNGFAAVGTYTAGETISIKNAIGQVVGTYTINSVNNNALLNPTQLNHVNVTEYDYDLGGAPVVTKLIVGTGLASNPGTNGLGSESGSANGNFFNNQNEAIHQMHF